MADPIVEGAASTTAAVATTAALTPFLGQLTSVGGAAVGALIQRLFSRSPDVSPFFSGNGEYAGNVQRTQGEIRSFVEGELRQFQSAGAEAQAFANDAQVQNVLAWQGQRNGITWPVPERGQIAAKAASLRQQESQRLAGEADQVQLAQSQAALTSPISPTIPSNFSSVLGGLLDQLELAQQRATTIAVDTPTRFAEPSIIRTTEEQIRPDPTPFLLIGAAVLGVVLLTKRRR